MAKKATAKYDNIIFYEISKGADGFAYISDFDRKPAGSEEEVEAMLKHCVNADQLPADANLKKRPYPPDGNLRWSTVAENGRNLYVLRIDGNMGAHFNKDPNMPESVICFDPHLPTKLKPIEDAKTNGTNARWATFTVDTGKIIHGLQPHAKHLEHEHECEHQIGLPLYLNLVDEITKLPAFLAANHHHTVAASKPRPESSLGLFSHRGPHFTSIVSMMYIDCPE